MVSTSRKLAFAVLFCAMPIVHAQWTATIVHASSDLNSDLLGTSGTVHVGYSARPGEPDRPTMWNPSKITLPVPGAPQDGVIRAILRTKAVGSYNAGGVKGAYWENVNNINSLITLIPGGATSCYLYGLTDTQQVGYTVQSNQDRAALFTGTVASYVDLAPTGKPFSNAYGISGNTQVGAAGESANVSTAAKWSGTASSYEDINPAGATTSVAGCIDGTTIGGYATILNQQIAGIWTGPSSTWVPLTGPTNSGGVFAISGDYQVGYIDGSATIWAGTPNSAFPLASALPAGVYSSTRAKGIAVDSTGITVVGQAYRTSQFPGEAVVWRKTQTLVSGNMVLIDTSGTGTAGTEAIGYSMTNGTNTYSGTVNVNRLGGGDYSFTVPFSAPDGAYTLRFKGGTFLAKTYNVTLSKIGPDISLAASLLNGDIDQDGEVGPSDFEAVVAQFGGTGAADVDNDDEVGPSDFEIIVANFGLGDE